MTKATDTTTTANAALSATLTDEQRAEIKAHHAARNARANAAFDAAPRYDHYTGQPVDAPTTNRTYIEPAATDAETDAVVLAHNLAEYRSHTTLGERRVVTRLLAAAFSRGYTISVNDGEEWTVKNSSSSDEITAALATTGGDTLLIRSDEGIIGRIYLVWGNDADGSELIADYTDTLLIAQLVRHVEGNLFAFAR